METQFKWTKKLQSELDGIHQFIQKVPSVQTIWLDHDAFDILFEALKYPEDFTKIKGIPYQGKLIKCINLGSIRGSEHYRGGQ